MWWGYIGLLVVGRTFGLAHLALVYVVVARMAGVIAAKPGWLVGMGVLADVVVGSQFGSTGLLLIGLAVAAQLVGGKLDAGNGWWAALAGLVVTVLAGMIWQIGFAWWQFALAAMAAVAMWMMMVGLVRRGFGGGVYVGRH